MKNILGSYAGRLAVRLQSASADIDPDILQLPGGSIIAPGLWLYSKLAGVLRRHCPSHGIGQ